MTLICIQPFGSHKPGDEVIVPDGAVFDSAYFQEAPAKAAPAKQVKETD
jgi:hypothetical protein